MLACLRSPAGRGAGRVLVRYGASALAVGLAFGLTLALWQPLFVRNPFPLFYAAVIFAAWYGGAKPGLAAAAGSVWAITYFLIPSFLSSHHRLHDAVQAGTFAGLALLVSSLDATRRCAMAALKAAKESADDARHAADADRLVAEASRSAAEASRSAAEAANRAKDDFLAVLSHELRTPLTPALAAAAAMEKDVELDGPVRADAGMIRRNIELEARLIDDLLDLTRITRGKLNLAPQAVDVHTLIGHVLEICRPDAEAKGLRLSVDLCDLPGSSAWVYADPARLHQVLWNLVKNAVKFTPEGGRVEVRTKAEGEGNDERGTMNDERQRGASGSSFIVHPSSFTGTLNPFCIAIEVRDTGIGIAPHVLPRVFDAFEQGERTNSHRFGGLGLGLAISKALVTAHGGQLTAASEGEGKGATFALLLPMVAAPRAAAPAPAVAPPSPNGDDGTPARQLRVLVVEDHADTARMLARLLAVLDGGAGCDVRTAGSVAEAMAAADAAPFDLLVSDLGLPDGHGADLLRRLRGRRPGVAFQAIALSGYGMEDDIRGSRDAGFDAHLIKPITFGDLEMAIGRVMGGDGMMNAEC